MQPFCPWRTADPWDRAPGNKLAHTPAQARFSSASRRGSLTDRLQKHRGWKRCITDTNEGQPPFVGCIVDKEQRMHARLGLIYYGDKGDNTHKFFESTVAEAIDVAEGLRKSLARVSGKAGRQLGEASTNRSHSCIENRRIVITTEKL
jgi:hypothetical protein